MHRHRAHTQASVTGVASNGPKSKTPILPSRSLPYPLPPLSGHLEIPSSRSQHLHLAATSENPVVSGPVHRSYPISLASTLVCSWPRERLPSSRHATASCWLLLLRAARQQTDRQVLHYKYMYLWYAVQIYHTMLPCRYETAHTAHSAPSSLS